MSEMYIIGENYKRSNMDINFICHDDMILKTFKKVHKVPLDPGAWQIVMEYLGSVIFIRHIDSLYGIESKKGYLDRFLVGNGPNSLQYRLNDYSSMIVKNALKTYLCPEWLNIRGNILKNISFCIVGECISAALDYGMFKPNYIDICIIDNKGMLNVTRKIYRSGYRSEINFVENVLVCGCKLSKCTMILIKGKNVTYRIYRKRCLYTSSFPWSCLDFDVYSVALYRHNIYMVNPISNYTRSVLHPACRHQTRCLVHNNIIQTLHVLMLRGYHLPIPEEIASWLIGIKNIKEIIKYLEKPKYEHHSIGGSLEPVMEIMSYIDRVHVKHVAEDSPMESIMKFLIDKLYKGVFMLDKSNPEQNLLLIT